jgi:hypothetical protein
MSERAETAGHHHSDAEKRRIREAALDKTIEASFPASDPLSSDPNRDAHDAVERWCRTMDTRPPNVERSSFANPLAIRYRPTARSSKSMWRS